MYHDELLSREQSLSMISYLTSNRTKGDYYRVKSNERSTIESNMKFTVYRTSFDTILPFPPESHVRRYRGNHSVWEKGREEVRNLFNRKTSHDHGRRYPLRKRKKNYCVKEYFEKNRFLWELSKNRIVSLRGFRRKKDLFSGNIGNARKRLRF